MSRVAAKQAHLVAGDAPAHVVDVVAADLHVAAGPYADVAPADGAGCLAGLALAGVLLAGAAGRRPKANKAAPDNQQQTR